MNERLYNLLPAHYRRRDAENGQPLRALLAVMETELDRLESDVAAAYDNWFIETCDEWVVPYLADLVGIEDLVDGVLLPGQRRRVANQSAYQRRKGLAAVLTHVIHDVTGWHAYAVESGRLAARTPDVRLAQHASGALDLRRAGDVANLGSPFETTTRTTNVRRIAAGEHGRSQSGRPHPDAIALFLWRLPSYPIRYAQAGVSPRVRHGDNTRHFTFDPLGRAVPLFVDPVTPEDIDQPLRPEHFPLPLTRAMLAADLERPEPRLYGPEKSVAVWVNGRLLPATAVISGDLGLGTAVWLPVLQAEDKEAVIDVRRGEIMLADYAPHDDVMVTYAVGFSSRLGCGPYGRVLQPEIPPDALLIEIRHDSAETTPFAPDAGDLRRVLVRSLGEALAAWDAYCQYQVDHPCAVIRFLDSAIYREEALVVNLPSGSRLTIEAANGLRPVIRAESCQIGPRPRLGLESRPPEVIYDRRLALNGLLLDGALRGAAFAGGKLDLEITRCTLPGGLDLQAPGVTVNVTARDALVGGVALAAENGRLTLRDSIVDGRIDANRETDLARVTVLGDVAAGRLAALRDAIVTGTLTAVSVDEGALCYSYVGETADQAAEFCVVGREERPFFVSRRAAHPEFARLSAATPQTIREGASNGAEMGAFNNLHNFQRRMNLAHILPDYVPLGQAVGVFYET